MYTKSDDSLLNARIIKDLQGCIDSMQLVHSYQHPRKNGRLYGYSDVLREACGRCFYWRDGVVYVFDGRVWVPFNPDVLKYLVRDALVGVSGQGSDIVKSDWVDNERKLFGYAMDGIVGHVLEYNASLVGFSNGVWDFSDMSHPVCHRFSERMPVTHLLGYRYDPEATCPLWLGFLHMMLPERDIEVLQKFMSLGCVDRLESGLKIEESLWLVGDGANGKSTIQDVISMVFGEWNVSSARLDSLLDRNVISRMLSMAGIEGRVFNMCSEISGSNIYSGSDMFKSLVSGEKQTVRGISRNTHETQKIPYFIFSMNQMPANRKMDKAFVRRMVRIDFRTSVKREDMDRGLLVKLASELSGIRNWVMEGWFKLVRDNYSIRPPKSGERLTDDDVAMYISNGQTVDVWIEQWAFISPSRHVGHECDEVMAEVRSTDLYKDYASYCENQLVCEPDTANQFGRHMYDRLHFEKRRRAQGWYYRVYCGRDNRFNINGK